MYNIHTEDPDSDGLLSHLKIIHPEEFLINEPKQVEMFAKTIGDSDKMNILKIVSCESKTITEILDLTKMAQSTGYKKIGELIRNSFLVFDGYCMTGKQTTTKYLAVQLLHLQQQ